MPVARGRKQVRSIGLVLQQILDIIDAFLAKPRFHFALKGESAALFPVKSIHKVVELREQNPAALDRVIQIHNQLIVSLRLTIHSSILVNARRKDDSWPVKLMSVRSASFQSLWMPRIVVSVWVASGMIFNSAPAVPMIEIGSAILLLIPGAAVVEHQVVRRQEGRT